MDVHKNRRGEWTDWNPDNIPSLEQKLTTEEPIPPLDTGECPQPLTLDDVLFILSVHHPEAYEDIRRRQREVSGEIADFEMWNKLIMEHNYNLHRKTKEKAERMTANTDFNLLEAIADCML